MTQIVAHHCRIPLAAPLEFRNQTIRERDVLLLTRGDGSWAEAAPLPGFSRESVDDVLNALNQRSFDTCPSLQFAIDCLAENDWPEADVPVNALLTGPSSQFLERAKSLANSKCRAVKLKVGSASIAEDLERVKLLRKALRSDQAIRLDANRAWDWESAVEFGKAVSSLGQYAIEYIEEPLAEPQRLEEFFAETKCNFALDESLLQDVKLDDFSSAAALVVKPTLVGSVSKIETLVKTGKPLVFSGCFESGVGTLPIARLAARFSPNIPHGLDTYSRIARDVLIEPLRISDWTLKIEGPPRVDVQRIAELST